MGFWSKSAEEAQQVQPSSAEDGSGAKHEAKFSHELLAGSAAYYGFKKFEDEQRASGKRVNHAEAKELLAGFVGAWADKLVETKGRDEIDKAKEKHRTNELAQKRAVEMYDEHYAGADQYDTKNVDPPSFENNI